MGAPDGVDAFPIKNGDVIPAMAMLGNTMRVLQGGPLPFINGVITPINGLING